MNAKDRALEKYPLLSDDDKEGLEALKYVGMECECASVFNEAQEAKQTYFIEGYHQAEKDLELTLEDIKKIYFLFKDVRNEWWGHEFNDCGICREVLKRFNKERKEKCQ